MENFRKDSFPRATLRDVRSYPEQTVRQLGVFSVDQALRAGWTPSALSRAVSRGRLTRPRRSTYRVQNLAEIAELDRWTTARWEHAAGGIAAVLMTPGARASHSTAAVLHGLPLLFVPDLACVTVLPWYGGQADDVHLHRCTRSATDVRFGLVDCHGVAHTVVDLAREHGVTAGVVALDHALHEGRTTYVEMERETAAARRWPGVVAARRALELADPRAESPLETRSRLRLVDADFPDPEPQVEIADGRGIPVGRVDFYWDEFGLVGEADGSVKYDGSDPDPLLDEKERQGRLEQLGLRIVRWGNRDLGDFDAVVRRLRQEATRGAGRHSPERRWTVIRRTAATG